MSSRRLVGLKCMRLTLTEFVTLDGVYQAPGGPNEDTSGDFRHGGWLVPFFDDALGQYMNGIFDEVDAFVLGRKTYEIFAASWPKATDPDDPIASRLNTLPKYVASRSLAQADWRNSSVLGADVLADVASTPSGVTMQTLELTGPPEYGEVEIE